REKPPPEHEPGAHESERDDLADGHPEAVAVVVDERVVDHVASGQPDERDLRGLRSDREDDGYGEAHPVRTEEAEQTHERRPVRDGTHILNVDARAPAARARERGRGGRDAPGRSARWSRAGGGG